MKHLGESMSDPREWIQCAYIQIQALLLVSCVNSGKFLNFSDGHFFIYKMSIKIISIFYRLS